MKTRTARIALFALLLLITAPLAAADLPPAGDCERIMIRASSGWWLTVAPDGSGEMGYGALSARVDYAPGTLDFAKTHETLSRSVATTAPAPNAVTVAVTFITEGTAPDGHFILADNAIAAEMFLAARTAQLPPCCGGEKENTRVIDTLWKKDPPEVGLR